MARQKLGQHFLIKGSILERIAAAVCPAPTPLVVEIGPGRGALTDKLLSRCDRVVAIELDPYLAEHLRRRYAAEPRFELVEADVLDVDLSRWAGAPIAGNLPYYITSPILRRSLGARPVRAVFLMQEEVAQRLVASPGSRDYGLLTVQTAVFANAKRLFGVKPSAFQPPPKVDSGVVLLEPRPSPVENPEEFLRFVALCFAHKRKTIRNNLAEVFGKDTVDTWPEAGLRAEQISLEGFVEMWARTGRGRMPALARDAD